jgi:hypothetical protein
VTKVELVEVAPGRFRVRRDTPTNFARSDHPVPYVISDSMPPTEQVDGKFYTSKREFRAVGRSLGLIEVGNEKIAPKTRGSIGKAEKQKRLGAVKVAIEKFKAGTRTQRP